MTDFTLNSTMREVETRFPFSRQVLFDKFHLGGCGKCGFDPTETLQQVAQKHSKNGEEIVSTLNDAADSMRASYITGTELKQLLQNDKQPLMVDVREPWEFEIAQIPGSVLLNETNMEAVFEQAQKAKDVVVVCHHGLRAMNATMYMQSRGIKHARCLKGGTDAYSIEVDPSLPRY